MVTVDADCVTYALEIAHLSWVQVMIARVMGYLLENIGRTACKEEKCTLNVAIVYGLIALLAEGICYAQPILDSPTGRRRVVFCELGKFRDGVRSYGHRRLGREQVVLCYLIVCGQPTEDSLPIVIRMYTRMGVQVNSEPAYTRGSCRWRWR